MHVVFQRLTVISSYDALMHHHLPTGMELTSTVFTTPTERPGSAFSIKAVGAGHNTCTGDLQAGNMYPFAAYNPVSRITAVFFSAVFPVFSSGQLSPVVEIFVSFTKVKLGNNMIARIPPAFSAVITSGFMWSSLILE
jgi:hypothetical protein